jgi:hypothetical protein
MKNSKVFAAVAIAMLVAVSLTAAPVQQAPTEVPQRGAPGGEAPPGGGPFAGEQPQVASGQLIKVDTAAREITIQSGDKEIVFVYIDATQITGVDEGAQGLTGKTGTTVKVTYQSRGGGNLASKIEIQEAKK